MMIPRPDLLDERSPKGIEVFQITSDPGVPACHVYMEAQVFSPDSRRFVLHRSAHPHGSDATDPRHQYLLCDLDRGGELVPLTEECGVTAPTVSPDGAHLYYLVDETSPGGGRLSLRRVGLDGTGRRTLAVVDGPLLGTDLRPSRIYPLSTLRSDGGCLAAAAFLGDGRTEGAPFGLLVFDFADGGVRVALSGPDWSNLHPQYCRSLQAPASRDVLVQQNHGWPVDAQGHWTARRAASAGSTGGSAGPAKDRRGDDARVAAVGPYAEMEFTPHADTRGADVHVVRDDGGRLRAMPWGRDGEEFCQGHQCWRGRSAWAITSTIDKARQVGRLIESLPVGDAGHLGRATPGGIRNDLTRGLADPLFYHFATDIEGARLIADSGPFPHNEICVARLGRPGVDPLSGLTRLLNVRCSGTQVVQTHPASSGDRGRMPAPWAAKAGNVHPHPFLSPDGRLGFFNSDESGTLQAYAITGLDNVIP